MKFKKIVSFVVAALFIAFSFAPVSAAAPRYKNKKSFAKNFKKDYYKAQIKDLKKKDKKTKTTYEQTSNEKTKSGSKQTLSGSSVGSVSDILSIPNNSSDEYKLTRNIDMKNAGDFASIKNFSGKFDGNGYTIKNLTGGALFDDVNGGEILNLKLENSIPSLKGSGSDYGFITNTLKNNAKMNNCSVKMDFKITKYEELLSDLGTLAAKGPSTNNFNLNLGTLAGRVDNSEVVNCSADVFFLRLGMTCTNYSAVPRDSNITINSNIGGLIGLAENSSDIKDCKINSIKKKMTIAFDGEKETIEVEGFLTTFADYDTGVNENYNMNTNTGVLIGKSDSSLISRCHANANYLSYNRLIASSPTSNTENVEYYTGGVAGLADNTQITNCSNRNDLMASSVGPVIGETLVVDFDSVNSALGGIVGATENNSVITQNYNIALDNYMESEGDDIKIGGIAGYNDAGCEVANCINIGPFDAYTAKIPKAKPFAGGIVGYNKGKISTSYNTGIGSSLRSNKGSSYYGAVAGANEGEIENTYYMENNKVSVPETKNNIDNSKKLTMAQMKQASNYVGFDSNIFAITNYRGYSMMNLKNNGIEKDFIKSITISPKSKTLYYNASEDYSEGMFTLSVSPKSKKTYYAVVNGNSKVAGTYDEKFNIANPYYSLAYVTIKDEESEYWGSDDGLDVAAKKAGTSKIYVVSTDGNYTKSNTITVTSKKMTLVKKLAFSKKKITVKKGKKKQLKLKYTPLKPQVKRVIYTSSNEKIATVNQKGVVTAKKKGKVTIKARTVDGSKKSAKMTIVVK